MQKSNKKKYIGIFIFLGLIIVGTLFILTASNEQQCKEVQPKKHQNIPSSAVWKGDIDGGNWILLDSIVDSGMYRFKIYRSWDGILEMDAFFVYKEKGNIKLDKNNWKDKVCYYSEGIDGNTFIILNDGILESEYPAFGGETWDIIKEKQGLLKE